MILTDQLNLLRQAKRSNSADDDDVHVPITANAAGPNVLVQAPGPGLEIMELFLWNGVGAQTLILQDGLQTLLQLTNLQAQAGLLLGYTGNGKPHFKVSSGNPFVLSLSVGQQVDGYVKYRIAG